MNVPKLRFKEFNDEWNYDFLKNISSEISYGMNSAAKEYDGINKYIRITDIDEKTNKYLHDDIVSPDGNLEDKYLLKNDDILFARTGASTGKTYLYNYEDGKMYFAGFLIRANIIKHNSNFIFQQTKLNKFNRWIKIMSMRSGQPGINSQEYGSYKFSLTSIEEENKISSFLSLLDKKIELQSKKIEALKLYKKCITHILFLSAKNKIYLKDLVVCKNSNISLVDIEFNNGKYPIYGATGIIKYISSFDFKNSYIGIIKDGASVGKTMICKENSSILSTMNALIPIKHENIFYVNELISQIKFTKYIVGSGIPHIYFKDYSNEKLYIHEYDNRLKIGTLFENINKKIKLEEEKLTKLETFVFAILKLVQKTSEF